MVRISLPSATAILAALGPVLAMADLCDRATIPYSGFTDPIRLDPDQTSNITTRTHVPAPYFLRTREKLVVKPSDSDDAFSVSFDIKHTRDGLQDAIAIVEDHNDVTFTIDSSKVDGDFRRDDCIVATTYVSLPDKLSYLIFDLQNTGIRFEHVKSTFEKLEIKTTNGGVHITASEITAPDFIAQLSNGGFSTQESTIFAKTATATSHNGHVRGKFSGNPIESIEASSNNGGVDLVVYDNDDSSSSDITSTVKASSSHGHVNVVSHLHGKVELKAISQTGAVSAKIHENGGGTFHTQTKIGHVSVNGPVRITKSHKTITGSLIEGTFGDEGAGSSVELDSNVGSVTLAVASESGVGFDAIMPDADISMIDQSEL